MIGLSDFPLLTDNLKVEWNKKPAEFDLVREQLAVVIHGDMQKTTDHSKMSSVQTARRRDDGGNAQQTTVKQGYRVTMTKTEIALELDVTKQMRMYDQYGKIMELCRSISSGVQRRAEYDLAAHLFYGWATSYTNIDGETVTTTAPDGLALFSASHTANGSANTYSNQMATGTTHDPFSVDVLERMEQAGNSFLDEADGRRLPTKFDTIITGTHGPTVNTVQRVLNSMLTPGSSLDDTNNSKNVLMSRYQHLIVPHLDTNPATEAEDTTRNRYVFLANLRNPDRNGFRMEFSQDPMLDEPGVVTESGVWQYLATADYQTGLLAANFIVGNKGDGTVIA